MQFQELGETEGFGAEVKSEERTRAKSPWRSPNRATNCIFSDATTPEGGVYSWIPVHGSLLTGAYRRSCPRQAGRWMRVAWMRSAALRLAEARARVKPIPAPFLLSCPA